MSLLNIGQGRQPRRRARPQRETRELLASFRAAAAPSSTSSPSSAAATVVMPIMMLLRQPMTSPHSKSPTRVQDSPRDGIHYDYYTVSSSSSVLLTVSSVSRLFSKEIEGPKEPKREGSKRPKGRRMAKDLLRHSTNSYPGKRRRWQGLRPRRTWYDGRDSREVPWNTRPATRQRRR
ncbi:unnamed protein product [Calypogeia fissa]